MILRFGTGSTIDVSYEGHHVVGTVIEFDSTWIANSEYEGAVLQTLDGIEVWVNLTKAQSVQVVIPKEDNE